LNCSSNTVSYIIQVSEESTFSESRASLATLCDERLPVTATVAEVAALRYMAEAIGDDWPVIARCLRLRSAGVHSARRRAELHGFDDQQTRLEVLSSWFRAQPRAADKVNAVASYLTDQYL